MRGICLFFAAITTLVGGCSCSLTFVRTEEYSRTWCGLEVRVLELESELETLEQEIDTLEARRAGLLAPDLVEKIAREKLGYMPVRYDQVVRREDRTTRRDRP